MMAKVHKELSIKLLLIIVTLIGIIITGIVISTNASVETLLTPTQSIRNKWFHREFIY